MVDPPPPTAARSSSSSSYIPPRHHEQLPNPLNWMRFDGVSPFATQQPSVESNNLHLTLQGRGRQNPLKGDPFGGGARVSTVNAYKAGKVSATLDIPDPRSGTIVAMYLIDKHPKGSARADTQWREADFEWLGVSPSKVQVTIFERGQNDPSVMELKLREITGKDITQRDPGTRYTIEWDLAAPPGEKYVKSTVQAAGDSTQPEVVREWRPKPGDSDAFWSHPLRLCLSVWSNSSFEEWSGVYKVPAGTVLQVGFNKLVFEPRGEAFPAEEDDDLEPLDGKAAGGDAGGCCSCCVS